MDDFVQNRARKGIFRLKPYIPGKPVEEVRRELGLESIIKLASNENPLGASPLALTALQKALDKIYFYPDANAYELKQELANFWQVPFGQIVVGNGSDELLLLLAQTFINPGDEVIYAQPTFSEYESTSTIMGGHSVTIPLKEHRYDLEAIINALNDRTKIIYICNPNNPTGTIVEKEETELFMQELPNDILVVFDEAYGEYVDSPAFESGLRYLREGRNVAVLRTFSKIYGLAGLRVGYAITTSAIAAALDRVREPFNVNVLAQIAAQMALRDIEFVEKSRCLNQQGKDYLYQELQQLKLNYIKTNANFIFLDTKRDCQKVFRALLSHGVIIRSGDVFGYPTYIRLTVGTMEENRRFINTLRKVLEDIPLQ